MSAVNIVISIEGGIPNLIGAFDSYTRAGKSRRELIKKHNSPFTRQEIIERFKDNPGKFDEIWAKRIVVIIFMTRIKIFTILYRLRISIA